MRPVDLLPAVPALVAGAGAVGARVFAADPWVNLVIAAIFLLLAFALLGMFELKLPGFITNRVGGGAPCSIPRRSRGQNRDRKNIYIIENTGIKVIKLKNEKSNFLKYRKSNPSESETK